MSETSLYQTKQQLKDLLCDLVEVPSVTGTAAEVEMAECIVDKLSQLRYFKHHSELVQMHTTGDGRSIVTALAKSGHATKTVILINHYDVVDVQDYGMWKDDAFHPAELTKAFYHEKNGLPLQVKEEINKGEWLFGRGTMDMKAGIALHISMLERASKGEFDGNVLFLSVPDEEVSSVGMRRAVPVLLQLANEHKLEYSLMLNAEPVFSRYPGDQANYVYTGSIGKMMPSFYCYGKETHVGEPFSGLNANLMVSYLTSALELNTQFCEVVGHEVSPPPTVLFQKDLKEEYSVQVPNRAVSLFNLFLFERSPKEVIDLVRDAANRAGNQIEKYYQKRIHEFGKLANAAEREMKVTVWTYDELVRYAVERYGKERVEAIQESELEKEGGDERTATVKLVDQLACLCKEKAPFIVLYLSPPFYPAVSSQQHKLVRRIVQAVQKEAEEKYGVELVEQAYFGGISDLSYAGLQHPLETFLPLTENMPLWGRGYELPLRELSILQVPVLNLGPVGRDAHQWTERLEVHYSFKELPTLIHKAIEIALSP
ncbi:M20/M25/M40 family metallo-hydrolase [Priestia megaterium]|nr:M20/M25/M40 family metallo-hydrolase [Priestia megaterium]